MRNTTTTLKIKLYMKLLLIYKMKALILHLPCFLVLCIY